MMTRYHSDGLTTQLKHPFYSLVCILLLTLTAPGFSGTDSLRCQNRIITIGETQSDVEETCGTASYIDVYQVERTQKTYRIYHRALNSHRTSETTNIKEKEVLELLSQKTFFMNFEEWTYNFGEGQFLRTLLFKNQKLISIQVGHYGIDQKPGEFNVHKGDTKAEIWLKYDNPVKINKNIIYTLEIETQEQGDIREVVENLKPVTTEEWVYDLGPNYFLRQLIFKNNVLQDFKNLKTKGRAVDTVN